MPDVANGIKIALVFLNAGFCFTAGMWVFCRVTGWAPVNMTVNTSVNRTDD